MIRIFNKKLNSEIFIDENADFIQFAPREYDDNPFVIIELKGFSFSRHSKNCKDCNSFFKSFGEDSLDWFISYNDKIFRLDTKELTNDDYGKSSITNNQSNFFAGTKMTLKFHELQNDKEDLKKRLSQAIDEENYEYACVLRDLKSPE